MSVYNTSMCVRTYINIKLWISYNLIGIIQMLNLALITLLSGGGKCQMLLSKDRIEFFL